MSESRLAYLFNRYIQHNCTKEEEEELMTYLAQPGNELMVQTLIDGVIADTGSETQMADDVAASILQHILEKDKGEVIAFEKKRINIFPWLRVAAVFILFLAGAAYWFFTKKEEAKPVAAVSPKELPAMPGGNHALLTLADGRNIILDSIQNGTLQLGSIEINKQDSLLIYQPSAALHSGVAGQYNTLSTPRGGQYEVVLPDGSKVWLNAASSLRFPVAFTGNIREVALTGEGYFEVVKNRKKPFYVKVGSMAVKVLGTHFNINAYDDEEAIKTTLLEGSVKITEGQASGLLKPGQQAVLSKEQAKIQITKANLNEVMAWKNGLFQFDGADITTIMRQISRWYDVKVVYTGKVPHQHFGGKISRNAQLSDVLQVLQLSNVKFSVKGKEIMVQ